jgi:REP element-mobilizing transposase RayT
MIAMPSTHVSLHYHVVFSTKDRVPGVAAACLEDVVRYVKAVSSRWVHEEIGEHSFAWQEGYGAFTVSASQRGTVCEYIARQEEHHRKRTFQEEYRELLMRSGVDHDERFLW